jgi:T5orf172 domain
MNAEELLQMLTEDEFGLLEPSVKAPAPTPEDRLVGAYEEILDFTRQHGRPPAKDPTNIAEFKLAMRLEAMCADDNQRQQLEPVDELGLLNEPEPPATIDDAIADDPFDLLSSHDDLFDLQHVPKKQTMPDKVARREPAKDFEAFRQLFVDCHADLRAGRRKLLAFKNPSEIEQGKFFVLNGVLLYVANIGEAEFAKSNKGNNARTRCIFENGTESDLLLLSLGRNLYKDGRRVTEPNEVTLERMGLQADTKMGYVYVLRSLSDDPQLALFAGVHKIGFTTRTVADRLAGAETYATFLGAPVEEVARYTLPAIAAQQVEALLHDFFGSARLDIWFEREGKVVSEANEWFDVPRDTIDEAIELINAETIGNYEYARDERAIRLKLRS